MIFPSNSQLFKQKEEIQIFFPSPHILSEYSIQIYYNTCPEFLG